MAPFAAIASSIVDPLAALALGGRRITEWALDSDGDVWVTVVAPTHAGAT